MTLDWLYETFFWFSVLTINGFINIWAYKRVQKWRDVKFHRALRLEYPDSIVTIFAIESTDEEAIKKIKEQLREHR